VNADATLGQTSNQEGNNEGQVGGALLGLPDAPCAPEGDACAPCVAQLAVPADRMAAMLAAVAHETEPVVTLTHLLHLCRDEHRLLRERMGDPRIAGAVTSLASKVADKLPPPGTATILEPRVREALVAALEQVDGIPPVLIARALAGLIDERYNHTFARWFRRRSPYQPAVGDPVPLDTPDLRQVTAMRSTSPPWRLAHRLDETRHVRLAGEWVVQFRVVFDYSLFDTLVGAIHADTVIATCHPNRELKEFDLTGGTEDRTFPVRPRDAGRQCAEIDHLIEQATAAGASIVILPELSVTEELAAGLNEWVRRPDGPRVLVAGSYHQQTGVDDASSRRRNIAIAWVRGHDHPLTHDKYSPADRPVVEDIQPDGWPELRVYVTADGWHLTLAICRDLLNPQAVNALSEAGANLVLVPAMSETLMPFGGPVAHLVGTRQALVAVANNPGEWTDEARGVTGQPARALFGHPGLGQQSRLVRPPDPGPGVALLTVRSAAITWQPRTPPTRMPPAAASHSSSPTPGSRPRWLAALERRTHIPGSPPSGSGETVQLRPAAVLVLLTGGPNGPFVLLTERAADLTDYPSQLVFPGGAVDACDRDPVAAALREADEEIGLDAHSVEVIGLMEPMALPRSGFLVYPVLAWSADPVLTGSVNHAEVAALHHVPLTNFADWGALGDVSRFHGATPAVDGAEPASLGRMTAAVMDQLLGILSHAESTGEMS
jgi:8-oxo-dGTP pyrophosphatase MutT (NUDIX family)